VRQRKALITDQAIAPIVSCTVTPVDEIMPIRMDSMLTTAVVPVPPVDGFIEGLTWSQYMCGSTAATVKAPSAGSKAKGWVAHERQSRWHTLRLAAPCRQEGLLRGRRNSFQGEDGTLGQSADVESETPWSR
jgi:hypothetical protein